MLAPKNLSFGRATRRAVLLAATAFAASSVTPEPVRAADNWQAYTYWGTPTVVASRNFRKLTEEIEQASNGELKIKFNLGGTLGINAININSAVRTTPTITVRSRSPACRHCRSSSIASTT